MHVRKLGLAPYLQIWREMREFTESRNADSEDEIWLLQHLPVFTLGQAGREQHLLEPGDIPVVHTDRGGQVTYHGPGQWVVYLLLDLKRRNLGVRDLVQLLEHSVVRLLSSLDIRAVVRRDAPGVYVGESKIAALGLRFRRGCTYHGLALNVDLDLEPFSRINPCGYEGLPVTSIRQCLGPDAVIDEDAVGGHLLAQLQRELSD